MVDLKNVPPFFRNLPITLVSWTLLALNTLQSTALSNFASIIAMRSCSSFSTNASSKMSKACMKRRALTSRKYPLWTTRIALILLRPEAMEFSVCLMKSQSCQSPMPNILPRQYMPKTLIILGKTT